MPWNCPQCGHPHDNIPKYCHRCHTPSPYTYIRCPYCKKSFHAILDRCPKCRQSFTEIKVKESPFETDTVLKQLNIQYTISGAFAFIALCSFIAITLIYTTLFSKFAALLRPGAIVVYGTVLAVVGILTVKMFFRRRQLKREIEAELDRVYKKHLQKYLATRQ